MLNGYTCGISRCARGIIYICISYNTAGCKSVERLYSNHHNRLFMHNHHYVCIFSVLIASINNIVLCIYTCAYHRSSLGLQSHKKNLNWGWNPDLRQYYLTLIEKVGIFIATWWQIYGEVSIQIYISHILSYPTMAIKWGLGAEFQPLFYILLLLLMEP